MTGLLKVRHPHHHVGGGRLSRRSVLPLGDRCKSCRSSSSSHGTDSIRNTMKGSVGQAEANAKFGFSGAMAANFTAATAAAYAAVAAAAAARKQEQATSNLPSCLAGGSSSSSAAPPARCQRTPRSHSFSARTLHESGSKFKKGISLFIFVTLLLLLVVSSQSID